MKKIYLLAVALLIVVACPNASTDIKGEWKLVSYGDVANPMPAIPNVDTSIEFDPNGQIRGNVGCNTFGGIYEVNGDKITFSSIMSTLMFCEETSVQEQAVLSILSNKVGLQVQMQGDTLTITSTGGTAVVNLERK
jgi:heat shock protein HslJ